jgi:tellurite resistance protein TehA-like permease
MASSNFVETLVTISKLVLWPKRKKKKKKKIVLKNNVSSVVSLSMYCKTPRKGTSKYGQHFGTCYIVISMTSNLLIMLWNLQGPFLKKKHCHACHCQVYKKP